MTLCGTFKARETAVCVWPASKYPSILTFKTGSSWRLCVMLVLSSKDFANKLPSFYTEKNNNEWVTHWLWYCGIVLFLRFCLPLKHVPIPYHRPQVRGGKDGRVRRQLCDISQDTAFHYPRYRSQLPVLSAKSLRWSAAHCAKMLSSLDRFIGGKRWKPQGAKSGRMMMGDQALPIENASGASLLQLQYTVEYCHEQGLYLRKTFLVTCSK